MTERFDTLAAEIRACRVCQGDLPHPCRPVLQGSASARIRIIGQAPGTRVQASGRPFTDPSGERLRHWMGVSEAEFYDPRLFAITPMGFCFPGLDAKGGDLPPRRECASLWHDRVTASLPDLELTLLVGLHAQRRYLNLPASASLSSTVLRWRNFFPEYVALPHPSWRNSGWLKRNPWFENEVLPLLRSRIREILQRTL
ncbi:uracil-DNA glycosylase [Glycocaulis albus]|uniref:Uracil-DNA glycosylase n=1 Tax=Glycocaulis albus TaxID=1382801 RepID=A0ABQ1XQ42_9PROT|nr:uracil-DNA glycosylase family protein [Glycocaulis albus]GGG99619.1 uracil-DNA glycosylase [Glycocaulis albus]